MTARTQRECLFDDLNTSEIISFVVIMLDCFETSLKRDLRTLNGEATLYDLKCTL